MACLTRMKALKTSSKEESLWGEKKQNKQKKNTTHKKALLASSEGVLALAF